MKGLGSFRSPDPVAVNAPSGAAACPVLIVVRISNNLHALVCGTGRDGGRCRAAVAAFS